MVSLCSIWHRNNSYLLNNVYLMHVVENRKARFEYFLLDTYEAGIVLFGSEVKTLRKLHLPNFGDSYCVFINDGSPCIVTT